MLIALDNLRTHKVDGVAAAIEAAGAKLRHTPAYSPDFNPIEQAFSKFNVALRKGAARTVPALTRFIRRTLNTFAPVECTNYIRHAVYGA